MACGDFGKSDSESESRDEDDDGRKDDEGRVCGDAYGGNGAGNGESRMEKQPPVRNQDKVLVVKE